MKDILEFIIKNITTIPDDVIVTESEEEGTTNYTVTVNPEDIGRIIGKEGKIIKSIRAIMRVIAIQRGMHVRISVLSETENNGGEQTQSEAQEVVTPKEEEDTLTVEL